MLQDFFDRRAAVRQGKSTWMDIALVAGPTSVIAVLTVSDLLTRWLAQFRVASPIVHVALPVTAVALSLFVIRARIKDVAPESEGEATGTPPDHWVYRFGRPSRQAAKIAFFPMIAIAVASTWAVTPNALRRSPSVAGYVCFADGAAIRHGFVQLIDRYGSPVSTPAEIDDRGFFYVRAGDWMLSPSSIHLLTPGCTSEDVPFDGGLTGRSCPAEPIDNPQTGEARVWVFHCR
jgi:hypothetical protein